ncbi:aminotransferase class V-fold PLP-dependent enzyme [Desulfovibrio sp. OttesenSCG-928-O18]|nr:aminotransferase class V-fold PLP-dependent enzyme [Desulfovibrio sp. OttesenSCG-928-O18]
MSPVTHPTLVAVNTIIAPDATLGSLSVIQADNHLGFPIKRIYYIHSMDADAERGGHAHKELYQCIIAVSGSVRVDLEGKDGSFNFLLDSPTAALLVPPGYWRNMTEFSSQAVLLVLASTNYEEADYIRDYETFREWLEREDTAQAIPYLDLADRHKLLQNEIAHEAKQVLADAHYILGPKVDRFERQFAEYCETAYCLGTGNGLDALELILRAYGIGAGDEVILSASGFIATPLATLRTGALPVFVDCAADGNIDPNRIEQAITPRTKAVLLTHLFGTPAEMNAITEIARKHSLYVFEDSCQAHGSEYYGKRCGGLGDAAAFSFYPSKNLGAFGDGGCITLNDPEAAERIRQLRNYGSTIKYQHDRLGFNSRLDELQAGLLSCLLPYLDGWNEKRRQLATIYFDRLRNITGLKLPCCSAQKLPNWHIFPVCVEHGRRNDLAEYLRRNGIGTNIHYPVPMHLQACCASLGYGPGSFPVTEKLCAEELSLPLDPWKTEEQIKNVANTVLEFFSGPEK